MIRFLRMFAAFRDLEARLTEASVARIAAESELRELRAANAKLNADVIDAKDKALHGSMLVADWLAQFTFGPQHRIYGSAPILPETKPLDNEPIAPRRRQASDVRADMERDFMASFYEQELAEQAK